jgi:hypothetical protein
VIRFLKSKLPAIFARTSDQISHPILVNSIPKAGTNLLLNIVLSIPNTRYVNDMSAAMACHDPNERALLLKRMITDLQPGSMYTGHIPHSAGIADWLAEQKIKQVFIYRDPRDITVSLYHYIMREVTPRHAYHDLYANFASDHERLMATIRGIGEGRYKYRHSAESNLNIQIYCEIFLDWLKDSNTHAIRYEDLVSSDRRTSLKVVSGMLRFLGVTPRQELTASIFDHGKDPARSRTYRRGVHGSWKSEYSQQHIDAFRQVAGDLVERLGYSWDD